MSENTEDIDRQLAENVDKEVEARLDTFFREKTRMSLETMCMDHENRLRDFFRIQTEEFARKKQKILTTMSRVAVKRGAPNAVPPDLFQDMEPESFSLLHRHFQNQQKYVSNPTSPADVLPSPVTSTPASVSFDDNGAFKASYSPFKLTTDCQASRKVHTAKRSGAQPVFGAPQKKQKITISDNIADVVGQQPTPSSVPPSPRPASANSKAQPPSPTLESSSTLSGARAVKNKDLLTTDVEGTDFVFKYPDYGPGWFVIRCTPKDGSSAAVCFKEHPLSTVGINSSSPAKRHFNESHKCSGHNTTDTKKLSSIEIMEAYSYRGMSPDLRLAASTYDRCGRAED